jgi:predicted nucleic acid-binding protein
MPFVLDASLVVAWWSADPPDPVADAALERLIADQGAVPAFWWFDVRHALICSERRQQRAVASTTAFLQRLGRLPVLVDREPDEAVLLDLARCHRLGLHETAYLELALRLGVPLATTNRDLIRTAPQVGVSLLTAP